jgi:hypothetical protein
MTRKVETLWQQSLGKSIHRMLVEILVVGLLLAAGKQALAQGGGWSEPVMLSTNTESSWWPDVAVDDHGHAYAVWNSGREQGDLLMYSAWDGQKWSEPKDIVLTAEGGITIRPAIAVGKDNTLHVTYRERSMAIYYTQSPASSAENAASWVIHHRLSGSQAAYYSDIAVDSKGHIHVVWSEQVMLEDNTDCPGCSDIFYRHSTDGGKTWSAPENLSNSNFGSVKPQIRIDRHDGIHVVWEEGEDWYVYEGYPVASAYIHSLDGSTWSEPTFFSSAWGAPQQITLGLGGENELVVVWRVPYNNSLYYQRSTDNGVSWSVPSIIPGVVVKSWGQMSLDSYDAATDSGGNVHVVVLGSLSPSEESLSVFHLVWNGTTWSSPARVFASLDPPEWPRIAIGGGNRIYVTWFTRDREHIWDSENQQYQVWCASSQSASPAQTPVPSISTPTPTVTPLATATPTATPYPTLAPGGTGLPDGLYTESDDLLRLFIGIAPVLILIAIILAIKVGWLRRLSR